MEEARTRMVNDSERRIYDESRIFLPKPLEVVKRRHSWR